VFHEPPSVPDLPAGRTSAVHRVRTAVKRHLRKLSLERGTTIVAAVSGGPDSTVLLDALVATTGDGDHRIVVAHFHHGIRGAEADRDLSFVQEVALRYGLPFHHGSGSAPRLARDEKLSLEDAARRLRHRFLEDVRRDTGGSRIALGHTRDDQAETVLANLLRGAGPRGLGGMPEFGPRRLIRPLLRVRRAEVEAYAAERGLHFRVDESNADTSLTRNRIRRELLPLLEERFNPNIVTSLARQADLFREIDDLLTRDALALLADIMTPTPAGLLLRTPRLVREHPALQRAVLRAAVKNLTGSLAGWQKAHFAALLHLLRTPGSARTDLPGGIVAARYADQIEIRTAGAPLVGPDLAPQDQTVSLRSGTEVAWGRGFLRVTVLEPDARNGAVAAGSDGRRSAAFDLDRLPGELLLRRPRPGDRMTLLGKGGSRKLSDLFVDLKVPRGERALRPVLAAGPEASDPILWVVGTARSGVAPITPQTRCIIHLDWFGHWK
jgi:tRNA(Ile)-lysidine synthase